jgi:molybdopterin molybdotransferase
MLSYAEALSTVLRVIPQPKAEVVPLDRAFGRVLADDCLADRNVPPFDKALMDGYAVRSRDLQRGWRRFHIIGEAAAGAPCDLEAGPAEAVRIMTGAPLPPGTDSVIPVEDTELVEPLEFVLGGVCEVGANVRREASEVERESLVLEHGLLLGSPQIGVLAMFGKSTVSVYRRPLAIVASTGDELVDVSVVPGPAQIRDSNAPLLAAQVLSLGLEEPATRRLADSPEEVEEFLDEHQTQDFVIFSGGLSMGQRDYVHQVLKRGGATVLFHKVAIKPGKPLLVARRESQLIFGLPGNPVSSWVTFQMFVAPAIQKWMGLQRPTRPVFRLPLSETVKQRPGRLFFAPGRLSQGATGLEVSPIRTLGSSDLVAFARAEVLFFIPADRESLEAGTLVDVVLLPERR